MVDLHRQIFRKFEVRLLTGMTMMEKQALNGRDRQKPQPTHKMRVRVKCLYFEIFIVVNRPYCPGPQR